MTWWSAVLGFVGALAGSWGGQIIASKREDKRWNREREREDIRHEREMERFKLQLKHDSLKEWRTERLTAYYQFLDSFYSWRQLALIMGFVDLPEMVPGLPDRSRELCRLYEAMMEGKTRLQMICSPEVQKILSSMLTKTEDITSSIRWQAKEVAEGRPMGKSDFRGALDNLAKKCAEVRALVRAEMLID